MVDAGGQITDGETIPAYNGGLFAEGPVDDLELSDDYTRFFNNLGTYDFADEVNLDVLGHLFESSITEVERLKETGFFSGDADKIDEFARMPQSAKRKRLGIYYTPPELTSRIVEYTVDEVIAERFEPVGDDPRARLDVLRSLKVVDPACGSGAFLFQAYDALELRYGEVLSQLPADEAARLTRQIPQFILEGNLYGVDLSPEAVEITQLALWIRSADRNQPLTRLSRNIVHGNSLVADPDVSPDAFDWHARFPEVFDREQPGFDCVIGNPPWERIKLQEREFFSLPAPEIATASNAAKRRQLVAKLESDDPALHQRYTHAKAAAQDLLDHCRKSGDYPLTGKGDINTYAVFAELAMKLVAPTGRVGLLVPSGIASDKTTKEFFATVSDGRLIRLYDFENKKTFFPDVHASFKFSILNFTGAAGGIDVADFVFFAHRVEDFENKKRHISLSGDDIKLLNPNTLTCPIFRTRRDAEITKGIYRRVPVLIDKTRKKTGNAWGIRFNTMFHQTNDAEHFREAAWLTEHGFKLDGNRWKKGKQRYLPLYEAKMVQMFDHRAADVVVDGDNWLRQGQTRSTTGVEHANPEHLATPRAWVESNIVATELGGITSHLIAFKDVTSPTNQRTMIASALPSSGVVNSAPLIFSLRDSRRELCLLANLNSFAWDFVARQKIGNVHLNFFIVEQVPTLHPDRYDEPCPWQRSVTLEDWIAERVLKLTCTAEDMLPLAEACGFTGGTFKEYDGKLHKWNERERAELMAELDAAYFHLYGLDHDDVEYVLSTFKGVHDTSPLLPGGRSTAAFVLELFEAYSMQASQ
ncbi:MAG: DNA methyltransferase [Planctomycetota bacterium]